MPDHDNDDCHAAEPAGAAIPLAKLSMPRTAQGVVRPRLHTLLDQARRAAAVWLAAPGGAGKSTLAATYITQRRLPYLWYQIDKDDGDPATFFYYLGMSVKQTLPSREVFLPLLTPEYLHDIPGFTRRYFRQLFNLLPPESVVVLDNFQDLMGAEAMHEIVRNAIGEVPQGDNIFVISHNGPPAALARLQVTGALEAVTWEDIRLRYDETEAIVQRHAKGLDSQDIMALHEYAEGWVAGLTLLLKHIKHKGLVVQDLAHVSSEQLFDYFASEFFDELPAATRDFLLQTALLTHITPSLAAAVSGHRDAGKILADLHQQHFFISRRDLAETTYQYHALFRGFLLARAAASFSGEQYLELTLRAGRSLEQHGRKEEAVALYLQSQAWDAAATLILAEAPQLAAQGRAQILADWIQRIQEAKQSVMPWLLYWRGISRQFIDPFEARTTLERAYAGFATGGDVLGQLSAASAIIDIVFFIRESLSSTGRWIEALENGFATNFRFPAPMLEARALTSLFSVLTYMRPQDPHLPHYADRLMALLDEDLEINQRVSIGAHLVNYYAHGVGDLSACERIIVRITPLLADPQVTAVTQLLWRSFCVLPNLLGGNDERAYETVRPLPVLIRENNLSFMELVAAFFLVLVQLYRGELDAIPPLLESMNMVMNPSQPADVAWLCLAKCWYALARGESCAAFNQGQSSLQMITRVGATLTGLDVSCLLALVYCQSGKYEEALASLATPRQIGFATSPRIRHQVLLIEAYVYLRMGNRPLGLERLREAMALGSRQSYFGSIYCWFPQEVLTRLCTEALRAGIEVAYTQHFILRRRLVPEDPHLENWPWPVRIYAMGPFRLMTDGEAHTLEGKAQYKPLKLLKALIALGGRDVKEEKISELLWPDAEGDAAHSAFTTTLSRLRKMLGDEAITVKFGRLSLNKQRCWVDAWALEAQFAKLQLAGTDPARLRAHAGEIIALYRGPFMDGEEGAWVERLRQRLQSAYFRFILHFSKTYGEGQRGGKQTDKPARFSAMDDPCMEMFNRHAMANYPTVAQSAEALEAYNYCREILSRDFGINAPDAEQIFPGNLESN